MTAALALGAVGYGAQAGGYFAALDRIDASLLSLVLYTFPVIVAVAAIALSRDGPAPHGRGPGAGRAGLVLVLAGRPAGRSTRGHRPGPGRRRRVHRLHPDLGGLVTAGSRWRWARWCAPARRPR